MPKDGGGLRVAVSNCATKADVTATKNEMLAAVTSAKTEILAALKGVCKFTPSGVAVVDGTAYSSLQEAAQVVADGGVVEIHGEMRDLNASAAFTRSVTIRGVNGGKLNWTLGTAQRMAWGKGLLVFSGGQNYIVENIELTGARVTDTNGAGIRVDPGVASIEVQGCHIHNNENGILSAGTKINILNSIISVNGNSAGSSHNVYLTDGSNEAVVEGCTFGPAIVGNQFKSRAKKLTFALNTVAELNGACSWQIDLPLGGDVVIERNVIEQGPNAQNRNMISYAPEGFPTDRTHMLVFTNNWVISDHVNQAWGVNLFQQPATLVIGSNKFVGNFADTVVNGTPDGTNLVYVDRASVPMAAYPFLPLVP